MRRAFEDERVPMVYVPRFSEFGLTVDGGPVIQVIDFCPWCEVAVPTSLRDEYFDRLERRGIELESSELPLDLCSDASWRMEDLA